MEGHHCISHVQAIVMEGTFWRHTSTFSPAETQTHATLHNGGVYMNVHVRCYGNIACESRNINQEGGHKVGGQVTQEGNRAEDHSYFVHCYHAN